MRPDVARSVALALFLTAMCLPAVALMILAMQP